MPSLEDIFSPGGVLQQKLSPYEYRASQLAMAKAVLEAIQQEHHLCVEAGTGTGKTLAYLIPTLFSRKRVIVSTATKNLQEQLFFKDIPFIREHLFPQLAVTYMKGRQNYLCLRKLYEQGPRGPLLGGAQEEWRELTRWAAETETGDRSELPWIGDEDPVWRQVDARSETCLGQKCAQFSQCFITRMRQKALESDLIVVNHALFFANLALQTDEIGRILPDFAVLILDEAHEIEDVACQHFGKQVSNHQVEDLCRDLEQAFRDRPTCVRRLVEMEARAVDFFEQLPGGEGRHPFASYRNRDGEVVDLRLEMNPSFQRFRAALQALYHHLARQSEGPAEGDALLRRLEQLSANLDDIFAADNPNAVYWYEKRGRGVLLHITPIDVAPVLREGLFDKTPVAVLTSATLTTAHTFEYVRERLGIPEPRELVVPGEFDYSSQAILYVPGALPDPRSPGYLARALIEIRQILAITEGHAFLLFTSIQQMNQVYRNLSGALPYPLLKQGGMPKHRLLDVFKQTPHAVLCATASFWQGVDVQGDALRAVIIDKLPFPVPSEPVVAARLHRLEKQGYDSFLRYSVPEAIIALKQGLGRLIRSRDDRGIMAILDSRLRTRSYGRLFLESLPNCPVTDNIEVLRNFFH